MDKNEIENYVRLAFDECKNDLARFLCTSSDQIDLTFKPDNTAKSTQYRYSHQLKRDHRLYKISVYREHQAFSPLEKSIIKYWIVSFSYLIDNFEQEKLLGSIRTAILTSLMDITIAKYLSKKYSSLFWPLQRLIQIFKKLSLASYENSPATTGVCVYRGQLKATTTALSRIGYNWISYKTATIKPSFFQNQIAYRLINGHTWLYAANSKMQVNGIINLQKKRNGDPIDRINRSEILQLIDNNEEDKFVITLDHNGEIEIFSKKITFIWRKGYWNYFSRQVLSDFLEKSLQEEEAEALYRTVFALSKIKNGTLILITNKSIEDIKSGLVKSTLAGDNSSIINLIHLFKKQKISDLKKNGSILSCLTNDGLTIFDEYGALVDTGIIVKLTNDTANQEKKSSDYASGGRTAAAQATSRYGKTIKVSEDGPIEFWEDEIRRFRSG